MDMITRRTLLRVLAVMPVIGGSCHRAGTAHAGEVWKGYHYSPTTTTPNFAGFARIAEAVEKETNGELKIQAHTGGSLPIDTTNMTQAVGDGLVQIAGDGFYLGIVTIGGILRLPLLLTTEEEYAKASKIVLPYLERAFDKQGCLVLGEYQYPLQVAWSTKKLTSLAELAGQKMRVTSPEQAEFVKRFGGIPVTIGAPEVPSALERKVVDGVFTASAGGGRIWGDLLKYNYRFGPNYFSSVFIVNKKAFLKLPPAHQAKLREIVARIAPTITEQMRKDEAEVTEQLRKKGMIVTEAKSGDYETAAKKMGDFWEKWAKSHGTEHLEALSRVRKAVGK
jgi:TRAP-type C4-dicarboxylate transport system substrate-binding protein